MVTKHLFFFSCFIIQLILTSSTCPSSIYCGFLGEINFPFTTTQHPNCGMLIIHGCDDSEPLSKKTIQNNKIWFDILEIKPYTITIRDDKLHDLLLQRSCDILTYNSMFTVNTPLVSSYLQNYVTVFGCNDSNTHDLQQIYSVANSTTICRNDSFYGISDSDIVKSDNKAVVVVTDTGGSKLNSLKGCSNVELPTRSEVQHIDPDDLFGFLSGDIAIKIQVSQNCSACHDLYGGQCRLDNAAKFYCQQGRSKKTRLIVAAVASAAGVLLVLVFLAWFMRRQFLNNKNPSHQIIELFLKNHGHLSAKRYTYAEIKKATNSFKNKLGQGGYGSVYKGKLQDGSLVAVKVLSESNGNGEEFINEVASISVTSHVNIVSLLGFYLEGSKRALIYDYMPNGSLEKFIYENKDPLKLNLQLSCKTIYNIAIGVARGLEYLHKGCNTKILHFDIKPHNILLDGDFCPKISDFGLAKVCPRKESIISLLGARGTAGYIAPEVFSRNFGGVSHKSDVYSYGMMVLEMVGGKQNNNIVEVEHSSEIYFPHWVYKRLELNQDPRLRSIKNEFDKRIVQKMIVVSLWCIQTDPAHRPAMSKVVDMMEGNLESLQIPPKPCLSSPPRSPSRSSDFNTHTSQDLYHSGTSPTSDYQPLIISPW
ncbi:LEAF RUST 10 DISEASE-RESISTANCEUS RECEPTOR-LIKE PROTEIN KINASE-like 2.4 [Cicer arietinum]|uniref:LEAF RUST 10 DISEASE-RESISTANCE LOCUS RECEPTOR-LIKE PROTEIN KINASE-like 2.4 n=1 Tax=Cicer arietinum TaxID=3827 RepID=A0A3Q7YEU5_CICAR|nr:LEAF RUST 10 DISEASE-RESISTANCE LOCUS RECEPTOR-LIKE PROTEIN KINASE-like 2.4 [Cicer arietinum]